MYIRELFQKLEDGNDLIYFLGKETKLRPLHFYIEIDGMDGHYWETFVDFKRWLYDEYVEEYADQIMICNIKQGTGYLYGGQVKAPRITIQIYPQY
jgi:hypothetical protein